METKMRVLVVGKGGREHALATKIAESKSLEKIWVAPGNSGMKKMGLECVAVESTPDILIFCKEQKIDLVVLGPEGAILSDLKENLEAKGILCLAPSQKAGQLEASKAFCKKVLVDAGLKTAAFEVAKDELSALEMVLKHDFSKPLVIKADGLAQGKGVHVCANQDQAKKAAQELATHYGFPLLFEQCLIGQELSAFALCDGNDFVFLGTACDYKRITPDPFSLNTGGMGAYSPCDFLTPEDEIEVLNIFKKSLKVLKDQNTPFSGFLFAGLMKTAEGLYILEFNVRMGDPETQALLPRIKSDFLDLLVKAAKVQLKGQKVEFFDQNSVHVVAVSGGYPTNQMILGKEIHAPQSTAEGTQLFFAGVTEQHGQLVNTGGRVLGVTAVAETRSQAREMAYRERSKISTSRESISARI
jgi:phosphoribosylamine--glycine ligase